MFEEKLAFRTRSMRRSEIRELLKLVAKPDIISFGGGMPDPTLFPIEMVKEVSAKVLTNYGKRALQYGPTEGHLGLREEICKWLHEKEGIDISPDNVLITNASQQGLDLVSKIFIDEGDAVIMGLPSYLGGIAAFRAYSAKLYGVRLDENGMVPELLEEKIKELKKKGEKIKFIYIVPDFQNPAGVTIPLKRRKKIIEIAEKYDLLIVEDTPYKELRYSGEHQPSFFKLADRGRVISLFTFSKILFPGLRMGYVVADKKVIDKLVIAKQATDLCSPEFNQAIVYEIMKEGRLKPHITKLVVRYRDKRNCMLSALDQFMPKDKVKWTKPEGGLFLWITLPEFIDSDKMFKKAIENKVAYIVGSAFHCDGSGHNTMRINFSYPTMEQIVEGVKRLSKVIKEEIENH